MKIIIVGGVAGGATAAARLRRLDEKAEIIIFERSGYVSYANCGLPYYIGGVIEDPEELTLQTPGSFWSRYRVDVRVRHEVTDIDVKNKTVTVTELDSGRVFQESYDRLILSPGSKPARPDMPGAGSEKLFTLRTVEDTLRIRSFAEENKPKTAVLVGGGYIGLEAAENLCGLGIKVTIIQRPKQLMNTFDFDMASFVNARFRREGVELRLGSSVAGFEEKDGRISVLLKGEPPVTADMVLLAIGVQPESALAEKAGLKLGMKGSIIVNDRMETSVKDIYAIGDAISVRHFVSGREAVIPLAGPANKQGRIAADNICGIESRYAGTMGTAVIKLFDMTAASVGLTEKAARAEGLNCDSVVLSPASHASYYPGANMMTMKVVFEKDTMRILGAQAVGYDGVDKRIDVIAAAIAAGMTADRLKDLELAYAPPYSSAKDPVNMAGFMIENLKDGLVKQFDYEDADRLPRDGSVTLLDTRTEREYLKGHAEGFFNIPLDSLRDNLDRLDRTKPVYVMCQSGMRSYLSCRILSQAGFDCFNFSGGFRFYNSVKTELCMSEKTYPCGMDK